MATCKLELTIDYDETKTDAEALAYAMDRLVDTALSTPNILDDYGNPDVGAFYILEDQGELTDYYFISVPDSANCWICI